MESGHREFGYLYNTASTPTGRVRGTRSCPNRYGSIRTFNRATLNLPGYYGRTRRTHHGSC
eukprot:scaffold72763_cov29-Prasinocladus_malaysianus.AAC.1